MKERTSPDDFTRDNLTEDSRLILINDDHNSFDYVIKTLVEVCGHDEVQAEQCTIITHFRGRCDIKRGKRNLLSGMLNSLQSKRLTVEME